MCKEDDQQLAGPDVVLDHPLQRVRAVLMKSPAGRVVGEKMEERVRVTLKKMGTYFEMGTDRQVCVCSQCVISCVRRYVRGVSQILKR